MQGRWLPGGLSRDPLRTLAYGTDASFYRLIPKIVINVENEAEVQAFCSGPPPTEVPVTFRAAGTSLSGQAVTDSVLVVAGRRLARLSRFLTRAGKIRLQPGIIGSEANAGSGRFGRKIGPDPASINAPMIGGILANNASGMCCGICAEQLPTFPSHADRLR